MLSFELDMMPLWALSTLQPSAHGLRYLLLLLLLLLITALLLQ